MTETPLTVLTFNGITFLSRERAPFNAAGYALSFGSLDGWYDSAPDGARTSPHWSGFGSVLEGTGLRPRVLRVRGLIRAESAAAALDAVDRLGQRRHGTFRVEETARGLTREVTARTVDFTPQRLTPLVWAYSLELIADDPLRYGSGERTLGLGSQAIANRGPEDAYPTLTLVGPHSALVISHPEGAYHFDALASGQTRVLDFRNGDVWDGQVRVFGVESGPRPVVRAGGSTWFVSGLGSGSATLTRHEAWS